MLFFFGRPERRVRAYLASLAGFPEDCDVYGISPTPPEDTAIAVLRDEGAAVARQFGAVRLGVRPSVFLVNPKRTIRLANAGFPSPAAIVRSIQALKAATRAGM